MNFPLSVFAAFKQELEFEIGAFFCNTHAVRNTRRES